jgi:hypothetical protein
MVSAPSGAVALIKIKARDKDFKAMIGLSPDLAVSAGAVSINLVTSHVLAVLSYSSRKSGKALSEAF